MLIVEASDIQERTKRFALEVIKLVTELPERSITGVLGKQLLRCSTSIGANYRAACRARSKNEFYAKMCIVVEEADETCYWLELLKEAKLVQKDMSNIEDEALQLLKIFSATRKKAKPNK